jgi:hypothetical protein
MGESKRPMFFHTPTVRLRLFRLRLVEQLTSGRFHRVFQPFVADSPTVRACHVCVGVAHDTVDGNLDSRLTGDRLEFVTQGIVTLPVGSARHGGIWCLWQTSSRI